MPASSNAGRWPLGLALAAGLALGAAGGKAQQIRFIDADPQQVGTAQPAQLGLPAGLWNGSSRKRLGEAIETVAGPPHAAAAHRALAAMLAAAAALPPAAKPGETLDPPLIARRVAALARIGADTEAMALAGRAPQEFRGPELLAAEADVRLLRNDLAGACNLPVANPAATVAPGWQMLRAFCSHAMGNPEAAAASAMLGSLSDRDADDTFAAMFLSMTFKERPVPADLTPKTALHAAMYRFLRLRPAGPEALPAGPAPLLAGLSRNPNLPFELRTLAAEKAVAANTASAEVLVQLYLEGGGQSGTGPAYRAAAFAQDAQKRPAALQELWAVARANGLMAQLAPFTAGMTSGVNPATASPDFVLAALRNALLAGDKAAVAPWRSALSRAGLSQAGAPTHDAAYVLLALAGETVPPAEQWWTAWRAAAKPSDAQQQLAGGLLGAVGNAFALMPSPTVSRGSAAGRIDAMAEKALGEAALRALAALGGDGKDDAAMQVVAVRTLARLHPAHARALALELAVAAGL